MCALKEEKKKRKTKLKWVSDSVTIILFSFWPQDQFNSSLIIIQGKKSSHFSPSEKDRTGKYDWNFNLKNEQ